MPGLVTPPKVPGLVIVGSPELVIPAKAGIHFAVVVAVSLLRLDEAKVKMDPGFRRDDDNIKTTISKASKTQRALSS